MLHIARLTPLRVEFYNHLTLNQNEKAKLPYRSEFGGYACHKLFNSYLHAAQREQLRHADPGGAVTGR